LRIWLFVDEMILANRGAAIPFCMRIAVVSDVHGNLRAFDAVLKDLKRAAPDIVVHGGDLAANGAHPSEVIDRIRDLGWGGVLGNTDEMLWAPERLAQLAAQYPKLAPILRAFEEMIPAMQAAIGGERVNWLQTLPRRHCVEGITVIHASPNDLWRAPLERASDEELESTYETLGSPLVVYGHIHRPYLRELAGMKVANTGSVSLSYDGDPRASYLLVDGKDITLRRVDYDRESEANDLLHSGLPHAGWLCRILLGGRYVAPGEPGSD
jgi:putative phosphoesterase